MYIIKLAQNLKTNRHHFAKLVLVFLSGAVFFLFIQNVNLRSKIELLNTSFSLIANLNDHKSNEQIELIKQAQTELNKTLRKLDSNYNMFNNLKEYVDSLISYTTTTSTTTIKPSLIQNVTLFDLNKPREPNDLYARIQCRKSANIHVITTLCVHDINRDVHVSGSIWRDGVWESHIVRLFNDYLARHPDWLVLDVGAQIGQYSLFAAKMGRDVVTVEPFYENIIRLHKAATLENIQNKITLITNAISNKRNEIKMLQPNDNNIGGQSLLEQKDKIFQKDQSNKYLVETILFDDIIPYLPKNKDNQDYKAAIMKIDIEGFEPYAFQFAQNLFQKLDIKIVFMEWGNLPKQTDNQQLIVEMIDFLISKKLTPYDNNVQLNKANWKSWPWDIIWKQNGL